MDLRNFLTIKKEWEKIPNSILGEEKDDCFASYINSELGIQVIFSLQQRIREPKANNCIYLTIAPIKSLRKDINNWGRYLKINSSFILKEFVPNLKFTIEEEKESRLFFYSNLD